jgi:bisphosphoglycerate-independent phosphoglycerate mutase (AlkP superfamily)
MKPLITQYVSKYNAVTAYLTEHSDHVTKNDHWVAVTWKFSVGDVHSSWKNGIGFVHFSEKKKSVIKEERPVSGCILYSDELPESSVSLFLLRVS